MRIHLDVEGTLIPRYGVIKHCPDTKFAPVRQAALAKILALRERGMGVSLATALPQERLNEIRVKQLLFDLGLVKEDIATALTREKCAVVATDPEMFNFSAYKNHEPSPVKPDATVVVEDYNYGLDFGDTIGGEEPRASHSFLFNSGQNRLYAWPFPAPGGHLPLAAIYIPALCSNQPLAAAKENHALELAGRIAELVLGRSFPFPKESEQVTQMVFEGNRVLHLATDLHLEHLASTDVIGYLPDSLQGNIRNWQANGQPKQHFLVYIPDHEQDG
jgi:hypothetical protein